MKCTKLGFSLIELMVVVAIIATISAIAMPFYQQYSIKSKIVKAFSLLDAQAITVLKQYQVTGTLPSTITIGGQTITTGTWSTSIQIPNVTAIGVEIRNNGIMIHAAVSGLTGMPGYIAPVGLPATGGHSILSMVIREMGGNVIKTVCGQYNVANSADAISFTYLPQYCTCTDLNSFLTTGTGC